MDQSKKSLKNGLQPQTIYKVTGSAKPKKVVFNPPALQRQEATLQEDDDKADTKYDKSQEARLDDPRRTKWIKCNGSDRTDSNQWRK